MSSQRVQYLEQQIAAINSKVSTELEARAVLLKQLHTLEQNILANQQTALAFQQELAILTRDR